jgi:cytochrome c oxidase cbb3-type subunit 2
MRTGPDLVNIGARQSGKDWHYLHLYEPQITSKGSVMPPFPFLFAKNVKGEAVRLPNSQDSIVPNDRALALVEYLRSLDHTYELPEAQ